MVLMATPTLEPTRPAAGSTLRSSDDSVLHWFRTSRRAAALEVVGVFAATQLYLWNLHRGYRYGWLLILAFIIFSMVKRRETPERAGLSFRQGWGAVRWMAPGVLLPAFPLLLYGAHHGRIELLAPDWMALAQFAGYLMWCVLQQFALQSYMHNRLLDISSNPHFTSATIALIFGSLHLPNPVLTIATLCGGLVMGEIFARHRNIWVLAVGQALVSTVIFVSLPDAWHHRLRVGPGYWWWEIHGLHGLHGK
jgi:hypothetical protein